MDVIADKEKDMKQLVFVAKQFYDRNVELQKNCDEQMDRYDMVVAENKKLNQNLIKDRVSLIQILELHLFQEEEQYKWGRLSSLENENLHLHQQMQDQTAEMAQNNDKNKRLDENEK